MIGIGIIGAGRIGKVHAAELVQLEGVKITGVCDANLEAANALGQKVGASICCSDSGELAGRPDVDGVLICSPTPFHKRDIDAALKAGKAIFCEKPLCRNMDDAKTLLADGRTAGKPFAIGFVRRHMEKTLEFKRLLDAKTLGSIRFCNISISSGSFCRAKGDWFADFDACGGVILDMLAHHIDLANWLFGKPAHIYAASLLMDKSLPAPADYATSIVTYAGGIICNFTVNWWRSGRNGEMMEVYGDEGSLLMNDTDDLIHYAKGKEVRSIAIRSSESGYRRQMKDFIEAIRAGTPPNATVQDGYNSLEVALKMIESAQTGNVIRL